MGALNPVRELQPGDRPRDWMDPVGSATAPAWMEPTESTHSANPANDDSTAELSDAGAASRQATPARAITAEASLEPAPARLEPQRYRVQFEASEEYVALVERAKALLSHAAPRADLGDLHLRAMRCLIAELERRKYAVTARPRPPAAGGSETDASAQLESREERDPSARVDSPQERDAPRAPTSEHPRQRGRHVPAAIRRAVFARDAGRCTHTCDTGQRCRETAWLELHHMKAFARGGEHRLENLALRCRAHNALAAEDDFGKDVVAQARDSRPHEPWAAHEEIESE